MSVKVFQTNKAGKIEFTRCELEKLLNETYKEGYADGEARAKKDYWTWTSPSLTINTPYTPYPNITCDTATHDAAISNKNAVKPEDAVEVKVAPVTTSAYSTKSLNWNEIAKMAETLLGTDFLKDFNVNGAKKVVEETPFTELAKELNF